MLEAGEVPDSFEVVASARSHIDTEEFRRRTAEELDEHASDLSSEGREALRAKLRYQQADLADPRSVAALLDGDQRPVAVYLALPPSVFPTVLSSLAEVGLPAHSVIVVEKPFGEDLESAIELNEMLAGMTGSDGDPTVFRIDHVLGLATVHNLVGTRLANRVIDPLWNSTHMERVEILWDEVIALEGRAGFYDRTGALEDVVQNHLVQILCLFAMEPPTELTASELHRVKADVLRAVRILDDDEVVERTRRARYTAGTLASAPGTEGRSVPDYVEEEGVDADRDTETFAEILLEIDTPRWSGTQFLLRTGKALGRRRKGVIAHFRPVAPLPLDSDQTAPPPNELRMGLDGPESFSLHLTGTAPGPPSRLEPLALEAELPAHELPAYGHVLRRALERDDTLTISAEEAELAWRIVTPIMEAWSDGRVPMLEYPAGSAGPSGSPGCLASPDRTPEGHPWHASI